MSGRSSVWRIRDFVRYWTAGMISYAGSRLTLVAMPALIYERTGSPFLTGLVAAFDGIAYVLFGLLAGTVADRADRKRLMIGADLVNAVSLASIPLAAAAGVLTTPHIFAIVLVSGVATVFFDAADFASLPMLVGKEQLTAGYSALNGPLTAAGIVAPGLAGLLLAATTPARVIALDVLTFVASALLLRSIARSLSGARDRTGRGSLFAEARAGLVFLWRHPTIRPMTVMSFAQSASGGAVISQFVPVAAALAGARQAGPASSLLFVAFGAGGLISMIVLPRLRLAPARIALITTPLVAASALACGLARSLPALVALVVVWSAIYGVSASNNIVYRQAETPEPMLSRVNAAGRMLAWGAGMPLGSFVSGAVASAAGARWAFVVAGGFALLSVALAWFSPLRIAASATAA
ncbi:MFS transporter [Actinoplanes sp. CA-030573]|uniref:MFS transporter n=1 Tax=Actinoplanes sp. CA-030573 TaxID=3239898 RepID=UPI003D923654